RLNRASAAGAPGISRQCYGILPKIKEVDSLMTPSLQERVLEVHPELAFYELNHAEPLAARKKSRDGLELRLGLLERAWECKLKEMVEAHRRSTVARDDIVDAMAACWTAGRVLAGTAIRLPPEPLRDSRGLRMEIVR
ncbi:MAG TPA: DUF429 domain-containing protein, partial [Vicinamibacteria bacterium]|nr:DUF429 domain-containing protein [Vicinamibacteria bacterium]